VGLGVGVGVGDGVVFFATLVTDLFFGKRRLVVVCLRDDGEATGRAAAVES